MERGTSGVQQVLSYLLERDEAVTRPAIAAAHDLSRPTVFGAVRRLESLGLVHQVGQSAGRPGRSPALYEMSLGAGLLASVDIGGSNVRLAVADVRGRILLERREETRTGGGHRVVRQVATLLGRARRSRPVAGRPFSVVAVSVPGVVGPDGGTVHFASNIDQPEPLDVRTPLQSLTGAPVVLENNVNLAAVGERWQGVARHLETFAVVAVGAGVGAGVMHQGALIRGAHGAAGEVAFLPLHRGRRRADVTAHDEAGGLSLLRAARARRDWTGPPPATVQEIFERAAARERPAVALVKEECLRVARIIASVCAVVDPQTVVLTGGVGANDRLIAEAERLTAELTLFPPPVVRSALGERASLIGAVRLAATTAAGRLLDSLAE